MNNVMRLMTVTAEEYTHFGERIPPGEDVEVTEGIARWMEEAKVGKPSAKAKKGAKAKNTSEKETPQPETAPIGKGQATESTASESAPVAEAVETKSEQG